MKERPYLAYAMAYDYAKPYPPSWEENKQADPEWMKEIEERHSDTISTFSLECNAKLSSS